MYQQPNHSYASTDSLRRLSSNNPFRQNQPAAHQYEAPKLSNLSNLSLHSGERPSSFGDWVEKNRQLLDNSDDDEEPPFRPVNMGLKYSPSSKEDLGKPIFPPKPVRADSDSSVNYNNVRMSSNNPFAAALNEPGSYVHHRDPPPPPRSSSQSATPPARPPKPDSFAPPSYEEAAGSDAARRDYPREKSSSSTSRTRRSHSHSEASRPHRSSREKGSSSRHRSGHRSSRNKSPKKPEPVKAKNLDTIDKLDVTGFFGGGFHHDGPFDACTPHRNKNVKSAPVKAFPPDGPNSSIKGYGGTDKNQQMNLAFGHYEDQNEIIGRKTSVKYKPKEAIVTKTYEAEEPPTRAPGELSSNPSIINFASNLKAEPVHGSTTAGLGSSTFIDGAPAPRGNEGDFLNTSNGGLGRKKSLVQRLRKNSHSENSTRRNSNENSLSPPEPVRRGSLNTVDTSDELTPPNGGAGSSLLRRVKSLKVRR